MEIHKCLEYVRQHYHLFVELLSDLLLGHIVKLTVKNSLKFFELTIYIWVLVVHMVDV